MRNIEDIEDIKEYKINLTQEQSIELLKNNLNKFEILEEGLCLLKIAIKNVLAEREADKNKIQELENKYIIHLTDEQYRKLVDTIRKEEKEKLKQKIKDKKREIQKIGQYLYTNINVRNILEELVKEK